MKQTKTVIAVVESNLAYPGRPYRVKHDRERDKKAATHRLFEKLEKFIIINDELKDGKLTTTAKIDVIVY